PAKRADSRPARATRPGWGYSMGRFIQDAVVPACAMLWWLRGLGPPGGAKQLQLARHYGLHVADHSAQEVQQVRRPGLLQLPPQCAQVSLAQFRIDVELGDSQLDGALHL